MIDLEQLKILAQLIDNMEAFSDSLEKAYNDNNGEDFNKSKQEILKIQKQISKIISEKK